MPLDLHNNLVRKNTLEMPTISSAKLFTPHDFYCLLPPRDSHSSTQPQVMGENPRSQLMPSEYLLYLCNINSGTKRTAG